MARILMWREQVAEVGDISPRARAILAEALRGKDDRGDVVGGPAGPVGPVDLGIVEGGLVDPALQIVGNQQLRCAAEKAEHAHVGAGPVRQRLRPGRLRLALPSI